MAAPTITVDRYHELVFAPKSTAVKADASQLDNMKFDSQHYERYYTLCRGAGGDQELVDGQHQSDGPHAEVL